LDKIKATDKRLGRKSNAQRRFIVVEGLYKNSGTIVPLDELVALKHEYCYRLIVDESFSFGTLGNTGRGVIEMANKQYMHDAEIVTISLENAMGSIGGVTVGNEEVVDHQRLSGAGYCFSASSPPFTASAAIQALAQLENRPELLGRLNENKEYLYEKLTTSMKGIIPETLVVTSDKRSPIVFLELADGNDKESKDISLLDDVAHECLQQGVAIVSTRRHTHVCSPSSALRLTVSAVHTKIDMDQCLTTLKAAVNKAKGGR
jgi:serine palmitoyltransferase